MHLRNGHINRRRTKGFKVRVWGSEVRLEVKIASGFTVGGL